MIFLISLKDYLDLIYTDFKKYISSNEEYCELLDLDFRGEHLPNYQKNGIVQLYLLRYAYAYLFEYKYLFKNIIPRRDPLKVQNLKILSVGCGNYLDYWGAALACNAVNKYCGIKYTGVDPVDWRYKVYPRQRDSIQYENKTFYEFLKSLVEDEKILDFNVIIFPKSIGEFSKDEFREVCTLLKRCKFKSKQIMLIFSLRDCVSKRRFDMNRAAMVVDAFKNHKHLSFTVSNFDKEKPWGIEARGIRALDSDFIYPDEIIDYIKGLSNICNKQTSFECIDCSQSLSRWPILKTNYITYSYAFIRRKEN